MSDDQELQQRVPKSLWSMLKIKRENWDTVLGIDSDGTVYAVLLQYRGLNKYTLSVAYTGVYGVKPFMVTHKGLECGFFDSLDKALELIRQLLPKVETAFFWDEIADARHDRFGRFIDRYGVGNKMITRLVETFTTLEQLREATVSDIENVFGIGKETAQFIADHFGSDIPKK